MKKNEKTIIILFSRYQTFLDTILYLITGKGYTHASIALDEKYEYFYSFNKKGFRKEYPKKHKNLRNNIAYAIKISEKDFNKIQEKIEEFDKKREEWKYSKLGVFLCALHIKHKRNKKYFCSQFVAEILDCIEQFKLEKDYSLYFPNKLKKSIEQNFKDFKILYNPI